MNNIKNIIDNTVDYMYPRYIPNIGWCCLQRFIYTIGLLCEIHEDGNYKYRYCYSNFVNAYADLNSWDGNGHPSGNWIKRKGLGGDYSNPNYNEEED